ncbi:response regulator transcription factor [Cellulomonas fimi]|uniref:Two component transcriptional regulator, LuxR family n=1 Tax=Cellulomonas fimi (strain ATCC 484 / DSM 20113 / JCM 1341 / CCUG 24087 / LMG 16345 / NBRC 15513 / NCIMB 8980 / NCTC 7547 / NRS-133) TaxID=590998 RepID=F4H1U1_CELFA|nr:response regulator transcription factor [Cellulomonas fimi]AEE47511.1 two component transcriptional regulator, LuxR family [Cellulomonas fimi ATCC 484]NNH05513.1 response regulator transcription factor [Cellulomonas fimi]VEH36426.1 Nitrogen regulation protein C [Cellulomonas fimi]
MRIVIAEDSVLLRDGLSRLLTAEGHDVTGYPSADELVAALGPTGADLPDVLVTDVRMPPTHTDEGLRAAVHLRSVHRRLPILVLSQYVEQRYAAELFAGDVRGLGYVLKDRVADVDEFLDALGRVSTGGTVIDPEVVAQILARTRSTGLETLTPRERDVLGLMAEGRSNTAIAERLVVGLPAVEKHVTSILTKLGLPPDSDDHRRVLAVLRWLEHGPTAAQPGPAVTPPRGIGTGR